jgi:hypothetical protein
MVFIEFKELEFSTNRETTLMDVILFYCTEHTQLHFMIMALLQYLAWRNVNLLDGKSIDRLPKKKLYFFLKVQLKISLNPKFQNFRVTR